jgi:glycosyltransferase involved in cell wall biosynthesis
MPDAPPTHPLRMTMNRPTGSGKVLIVVPALNEAATITEVIRSISEAGPQWDILVVNDGSVDRTGPIAAAASTAMVIDLCSNLGIGGAVQTGFKFALANGYAAVVQVDGDGQHDASCIGALLDAVSSTNADVVIGSRFHEGAGGSFQSTKLRRLGIRILRALCGLATGYGVFDVTSGFRAYNRRALSLVARHYPMDFPEPESFVLFRRAGLNVGEIPVTMRPRRFGVSSISGFASTYYMVKVLVALLMYSLGSKRDFSDPTTGDETFKSNGDS